MVLVYWSFRSSTRRGGDGVNEVDGGYRYFSPLGVSLHGNLVQQPSSNNLANAFTIEPSF